MISGMKKAAARHLNRLFIEREIILRTDGKVRYLRLSRGFQKAVGVLCLVLLGWVSYATGSYLFHAERLASKDREIEDQRAAYVHLLSEVDEYEDQFERIARDLEGNQTELLTLLDKNDESVAKPAEQPPVENAKSEAEDSEDVRERLQGFEDNLAAIADRNASLRSEVSRIKDMLRSSEHERGEVQTARDELAGDLEQLRDELVEVTEARDEFRRSVDSLNEELDRSRNETESLQAAEADLRDQIGTLEAEITRTSERETELNETIGELERTLALEVAKGLDLGEQRNVYEGRISNLEGQIADSIEMAEDLGETIANLETSLEESRDEAAQLGNQRDYYEARVVSLEQKLQSSDVEGQQFDQTIADLKASLAAATGRNQRLEQQRDFYEQRVAALENRLEDLRDTQHTIVKRISDRTMVSLETMEQTLTVTGLDIGSLFSHQDIDPTGIGQGGPFMPGDYISETDYGDDLLASVRVLDMQMSRWDAMQEILSRLPLVAPLDHYRLTSKFGTRVDPINGRKGAHYGIDLGAPLRTPVMSTAPGKVVFAGWRGRYGRMIEIDHGLGIHTRYGHLKKILVKPGQQVGHREKIGLLGSSGRSTGPHVHYEVLVDGKPNDPAKFLKAGRNVFKG